MSTERGIKIIQTLFREAIFVHSVNHTFSTLLHFSAERFHWSSSVHCDSPNHFSYYKKNTIHTSANYYSSFLATRYYSNCTVVDTQNLSRITFFTLLVQSLYDNIIYLTVKVKTTVMLCMIIFISFNFI